MIHGDQAVSFSMDEERGATHICDHLASVLSLAHQEMHRKQIKVLRSTTSRSSFLGGDMELMTQGVRLIKM